MSARVAAATVARSGSPPAGAATAARFASPASTSLDELVGLRPVALAERARVRRRSGAALAGPVASGRLGRGLDFAEVREYRAGDDVRLIDWKVTARTQRPHTKLFVEERDRPVHLLVDFRSAMRFGTRGMYKSVLAARLAAAVGWSAVSDGDRAGGVVFTDERHVEVRPAGGRRGLMALFRATVQCQNLVPRAGGAEFADVLARLARTAAPGATLWLFSDFADLDARGATLLGGALAAHDLVAVHVVDPLDQALPPGGLLDVVGRAAPSAPGARRARGPRATAAARVAIRTEAQRRRYAEAFRERRALLEGLLVRGRHPLVTAATDAPFERTLRRVLARDAADPGSGSHRGPRP